MITESTARLIGQLDEAKHIRARRWSEYYRARHERRSLDELNDLAEAVAKSHTTVLTIAASLESSMRLDRIAAEDADRLRRQVPEAAK